MATDREQGGSRVSGCEEAGSRAGGHPVLTLTPDHCIICSFPFAPLHPPQKPGLGTIWVLATGGILSCDSTFTDWMGLKQDDIYARPFSDFVVERDEVDRRARRDARE